VSTLLPEPTETKIILRSKKVKTDSSVPEVNIDDLHIDYSSPLGSGVFETVKKAKWAGSVVVIKALTATIWNRSTMFEMVEKEMNITSKIHHPNIGLFFAAARVSPAIFLVHQYIDGCNMENAIFDQKTKKLMDIKQGHILFIIIPLSVILEFDWSKRKHYITM
jgi:serine/threonine protein kinase